MPPGRRVAVPAIAMATFLAASAIAPNAQARLAPRAAKLGLARWSYGVVPVRGLSEAAALRSSADGLSVPLWSSTIRSLGGSYNYSMVGSNPRVRSADSLSKIAVEVVPLAIHFTDHNVTLDPSKPDRACHMDMSAEEATLESSLFAKHLYVLGHKKLGKLQYEDMFMRAQYARFVLAIHAPNPGYGVVLEGHKQGPLSVTVRPNLGVSQLASSSGRCGAVGFISYESWINVVEGEIIPKLSRLHEVNPDEMLVLLMYNVVLTAGGCCIAGYHSGKVEGTTVQWYAVADYDSVGLSGTPSDVEALSHELGEWLNDPFGFNPTPAWGHTGQVPGCQATLEVGDPLSGTTVAVKMPDGITYHPQELAFFSWFYRQVPSIGLHGWYSSHDTFKKDAGAVCR